jgi:hypothetical protein
MGCGCTPQCGSVIDTGLLLSKICALNISNLAAVTDCVTVTVAGSYGQIGDTIQVIRWFDSTQVPPTSFVTTYINTRTQLVVDGITSSNTSPCTSGGGGGGGGAYSTGTATIGPVLTSTSGTVAAGSNKVVFQNVGSSPALVQGIALGVGQSVEFNSFANPAAQVFYRLPAITYDGSGTSLYINDVR